MTFMIYMYIYGLQILLRNIKGNLSKQRNIPKMQSNTVLIIERMWTSLIYIIVYVLYNFGKNSKYF